MPAPRGNKNGLGNRGGRRPSAKEEEAHLEAWRQDQLIEKLKAKIDSGKYSGFDMFLYMALVDKNTKIMVNWSNKVLADLHDLRGKDGAELKGVVMYPEEKHVG